MKKLRIPQRGYPAFLFFLLFLFISTSSFANTKTSILSGYTQQPTVHVSGCLVTQRETYMRGTASPEKTLVKHTGFRSGLNKIQSHFKPTL